MLNWSDYECPERMAYAAWSAIAETHSGAARRLIRQAPTPMDALDMLGRWLDGADMPPAYRPIVERWASRVERMNTDELVDKHLDVGGFLLTPADAAWPNQVDDLDERSPIALWGRGTRLDLLTGPPAVALVGARASTAAGERLAAQWGQELSMRGIPIISGGAYGIDAAAHRGALAADGGTIAVMAGGVDRLYPRGNEELLWRIHDDGLIISEHPPGRQPSRIRFLERNRLIAALSKVTVVVQAALRSGALRTAREAHDLNRSVAAAPGAVTDVMHTGCNEAIRGGLATLVTRSSDIAELAGVSGQHLGAERQSSIPGILDGLDEIQARVYDALPKRQAALLPTIADIAGLTQAEVRAALGYLHAIGMVKATLHGYQRSR
ncbi:MAG: DNA-processing protein DprA [Bowdeniella nasicola]|nr:DNA-processing protein DprA [Bowdeniella nasicola]